MWRGFTDALTFDKDKQTIISLRNDVVKILEELIKELNGLEDIIEAALSEKDIIEKWLSIIKAFNSFATLFNSRLEVFSALYETVSNKARHNKMIERSKSKDKKNLGISDLSDDFTWQDFPALAKTRFKTIQLITV